MDQRELPIPSEGKDGIFEDMAQLFIDTYEELIAAMNTLKNMGIDPDNRKERVNDLQMRYMGIIEKYQNKLFEQTGQEKEMNPETEITMCIDPAVMNSWENEIISPSGRQTLDGDGEPPIFA